MRNRDKRPDLLQRLWTDKAQSMAILCGMVSVFLAITGPFDTFGKGSFATRLLFWSVIVAGAVLIVLAIKPWTQRWVPGSVLLREAVTIALFVAVFMPFLVFWIDLQLLYGKPRSTSVLYLTLYVIGISVLIAVSMRLLSKLLQRISSNTLQAASGDQHVRFYRRLPRGFTGKVLRLSGDGHLVKVVSTQGVFDVRLRLGDAVEEMGGVPGFWCHRSHWVATEAVTGGVQCRARNFLTLSNGDRVPVGPKYQPALEAAGFDFVRGIETQNA